MRTRIRWGNIIIIGHRTLGAVQQQVAAVVVLLLVVLAVCAERGYGAIQEHLVTNLPGQPVVSFRQYAGYIPVDASGSKQLSTGLWRLITRTLLLFQLLSGSMEVHD